MKKLKLNEQMAKEFFDGSFGEIYNRELIEENLKMLNGTKMQTMEMSCTFFDKNTMDYDENDVEIIVTCTLKKIDA
jgi:hypothetical protein